MQRRLVKSPPELWAEISDAEALGRHLDLFGEIRISRLDPESTVAWEGDRASGTVVLDASGWGTRVTLTADVRASEPAAAGGSAPLAPSEDETTGDTTPVAATEPVGGPAVVDPTEPAPGGAEPPTARPGFFARLFRRKAVTPEPTPVAALPAPVAEPEPVAPEPPQPEPDPEPQLDAAEALAALEEVLDTLGAAHHRPFSR